MRLAYLAIPALIAGFSLAGCATTKATVSSLGTIAKAIQEDVAGAKTMTDGLLDPTPEPVDPVVPLGPAKVYTQVPQNEK